MKKLTNKGLLVAAILALGLNIGTIQAFAYGVDTKNRNEAVEYKVADYRDWMLYFTDVTPVLQDKKPVAEIEANRAYAMFMTGTTFWAN